jgi:hypothetical protein
MGAVACEGDSGAVAVEGLMVAAAASAEAAAAAAVRGEVVGAEAGMGMGEAVRVEVVEEAARVGVRATVVSAHEPNRKTPRSASGLGPCVRTWPLYDPPALQEAALAEGVWENDVAMIKDVPVAATAATVAGEATARRRDGQRRRGIEGDREEHRSGSRGNANIYV